MMLIRQFTVAGILMVALLALPGVASAVEVYATIVPQKYFIEKIGGDRVDVHVLVQPGANPHMYEPTPKQMAALTRAKVYFAVGVTLEDAWLPRILDSNRDLQIVHSDDGIEKLPMKEHGHHEESRSDHRDHAPRDHATSDHEMPGHGMREHGTHGSEAHEQTRYDDTGRNHDAPGHTTHTADGGAADPHIWLDPIRVKSMARNIFEGLVAVDPEHATEYRDNLEAFTAELDRLHETLAKRLSTLAPANRSFLVFHPSWGYFADRYGLRQIAVEEGGNEPSPSHLAEIIRHCRENGIRVVFVQPQFSLRSAEVIASEIGGHVVPLDPLAEDWERNLKNAANAFVEGAQ